VSFANSALNRTYVAEYTINASNTWERKTITIPVDTVGTWLYDNGVGLRVRFSLATGSNFHTTKDIWQTANNVIATVNQVNQLSSTLNTFRLALVQLEAGATATQFETRSVGTELALCQRYFQAFPSIQTVDGYRLDKTNFTFPVQMRIAPTVNAASATAYGTNLSNIGGVWGSTIFGSGTTTSGTTIHQELNNASIILITVTAATMTAEL